MIHMEVDKFVKKEILATGGGSLTRSMPPIPPNAINLLAGDPDFNQPEFISRAVYDAMREGARAPGCPCHSRRRLPRP